jgi:hypothetical protein
MIFEVMISKLADFFRSQISTGTSTVPVLLKDQTIFQIFLEVAYKFCKISFLPLDAGKNFYVMHGQYGMCNRLPVPNMIHPVSLAFLDFRTGTVLHEA